LLKTVIGKDKLEENRVLKEGGVGRGDAVGMPPVRRSKWQRSERIGRNV